MSFGGVLFFLFSNSHPFLSTVVIAVRNEAEGRYVARLAERGASELRVAGSRAEERYRERMTYY